MEMTEYEELRFFDILQPVRRLLEQEVLWINEEGKIERKQIMASTSLWLFGERPVDRDCELYHKIIFNYYHFAPRNCHNCWKIVAKPRNLKEAYGVHDLQRKLALPSKVGPETRLYSGNRGGWSAFWYAPLKDGLEGGRELLKRVKRTLLARFGHDLGVFLKRGCTEMERAFGPSDRWEYTKGNELTENMIEAVYELGWDSKQPLCLEVHIKRQWIEWAIAHGDMTYLDYTGGKVMITPPVMYDESVHSVKDFRILEKEKEKEKEIENEKGNARDKELKCEGCKADCKDRSGKGHLTLI